MKSPKLCGRKSPNDNYGACVLPFGHPQLHHAKGIIPMFASSFDWPQPVPTPDPSVEMMRCPQCDAVLGQVHGFQEDPFSHSDVYEVFKAARGKHAEGCDFGAEAYARMDAVVSPRSSVLREAETLITGDRNKTYGSPTENFSNIAALWNVQVGHKLSAPLTATEVGILLAQVKLARMIAQPKRDNYVDAAGYLACAFECQEAEDAA